MAPISVSLMVILAACTTTVTKIKDPIFAISTDSLAADLNKLVKCERFKGKGKEVTTGNATSSDLEVDVINGKKIPEDKDSIAVLAHSIASAIKNSLKDKNEFDTYTVLFMKVQQSSTLTTRTWRGRKFKSAEL
jgi:hypothetical protein